MDQMDMADLLENQRTQSIMHQFEDLFPQKTHLFIEVSNSLQITPEDLFFIFKNEEKPVEFLTKKFESQYSQLARAFEAVKKEGLNKTPREIAEMFCKSVGKTGKAIELIEKTLITRAEAIHKFEAAMEIFNNA